MNLQFRGGERKCPSGIDFPLLRVTECQIATFISRGLLPLAASAEKKIHALCHGDLFIYILQCLHGKKSVITPKTNIPRVCREIYVNYLSHCESRGVKSTN